MSYSYENGLNHTAIWERNLFSLGIGVGGGVDTRGGYVYKFMPADSGEA
jgi:hypothetical protein